MDYHDPGSGLANYLIDFFPPFAERYQRAYGVGAGIAPRG